MNYTYIIYLTYRETPFMMEDFSTLLTFVNWIHLLTNWTINHKKYEELR